jgi:hypothetical protein
MIDPVEEATRWRPNLSAAIPRVPEDHLTFRLGQLLLLFEVAIQEMVPVKSVDRLAYYDFFAANPFIVFSAPAEVDEEARLTLRLAGFTRRQLSYSSTGQRFVGRRQRLQHDLALLLGYGLVRLRDDGYSITGDGRILIEEIRAEYVDQYASSARLVLRRLHRFSDARLRSQAQEWLGGSWLLVDFLDDVREAVVTAELGYGR